MTHLVKYYKVSLSEPIKPLIYSVPLYYSNLTSLKIYFICGLIEKCFQLFFLEIYLFVRILDLNGSFSIINYANNSFKKNAKIISKNFVFLDKCLRIYS